jgi:hypothetical protein
VPYMRTVKTTSGATAVQVVWSSRRGSWKIEHLGSAHDEAALEALKAAVQQRTAAGQPELDLGLEPTDGGPAADHLLEDEPPAGFPRSWLPGSGAGGRRGRDEVFGYLVLARIIEPSSKLDSLRVLEEAGVAPAPYATVRRRLPALRGGGVAAAAVGSLRCARRSRAGQPGALRRVHALLRDRCR